MCLIIDTNCLANVFKTNSEKHQEFKPILEWILIGCGKVVFGGTKYKNEIDKYLDLFVELRKLNKAVQIDEAKTDRRTEDVAAMIQHPDFDDQHLVGLLLESGCKVICSEDKRAHRFLVHKLFFPRNSLKPHIYSGGKGHRKLLCNRNMAEICRPAIALNNKQRALIKPIFSSLKL